MRVRYRVDGALHEVMKPPIKMRAALTSRIKIMAQLNIAERRVPQDGRIKLKFGAKVIDYRVSTLPVLFGEKIVLRILDKGNLTLDLTKFGFEPKAESERLRAILNPYGMVLVTGPIAIKAALTGHLVLSTLHTNDAPSTVTRMIDMGIEPFNVASAVNLIVAQRLVRRVCSECKQEHTYTAEEIHA